MRGKKEKTTGFVAYWRTRLFPNLFKEYKNVIFG